MSTEPLISLYGTVFDRVAIGNPTSNEVLELMVVSDSVDITQSIYPSRREVVALHTDTINQKLRQANVLHSTRTGYKNGRFKGSRTQATFFKAFSQQETYYDSYVPNPIDISVKNGVALANLLNGSGSLVGSTRFGLPEALGTDIPVIFGTSVPPSLVSASVVDTQWLQSPYPFQTRYRSLPRLLKHSFQLPGPLDISVDMTDGSTIDPVTKSSTIGSVYYVTDETITGFYNQVFQGEYAFLSATFTEGPIPGGSDNIQTKWYGSAANDLPKPFFGKAYQMLVGEASGSLGVVWVRDEFSTGWTEVFPDTSGPLPPLRAAAVSRGENLGISQFGRWVIVGDDGCIITGSTNTASDLVRQTTVGHSGHLYGVANQCTEVGVKHSSGRFVAVGASGAVLYSDDYKASSWTLTTLGGGTPTFRSVDYHPIIERFIAVGDAGTIYVSDTDDGASTWTQVTTTGNLAGLAGLDLVSVKCHYEGLAKFAVITAENGILAFFAGTTLTLQSQWTVTTAPDGYTGTLRCAGRTQPGDPILFYVAGDDGNILQIERDGTVASATTLTTPTLVESFNTMTDYNIWFDPDKNWPGSADFVVAGSPKEVEFETIGRVVDIVSDGYTFDEVEGIFINNGDSIIANEPGLPPSSYWTRSTITDGLTTYYGFGQGSTFNIGSGYSLDEFTFLPKVAVDFRDAKFNLDDLQKDAIRFVGPRPEGLRYGILSTSPVSSHAVFSRTRFGQVRDMLEQRQSIKALVTDANSTTVTRSPVVITFVSGTTTYVRAQDYKNAVTASAYNPTDSGFYDYEYRSGMPFFDDQPGGVS